MKLTKIILLTSILLFLLATTSVIGGSGAKDYCIQTDDVYDYYGMTDCDEACNQCEGKILRNHSYHCDNGCDGFWNFCRSYKTGLLPSQEEAVAHGTCGMSPSGYCQVGNCLAGRFEPTVTPTPQTTECKCWSPRYGFF